MIEIESAGKRAASVKVKVLKLPMATISNLFSAELTRITEVREASVGVHDRRRRDRTDAHGDARHEQLRESKRPWSSSFDLAGGAAFDGVVHGHRRGRVEERIADADAWSELPTPLAPRGFVCIRGRSDKEPVGAPRVCVPAILQKKT